MAGLQIQHDGPAGRDRPASAGAHRAPCTRGARRSARATTTALADLPLRRAGAVARRATVHARHLYTVLVDARRAAVSRDELQAALRERGVGHEHPLPRPAPASLLPRAVRLRARHVPGRRGGLGLARCRCRCRRRCPTRTSTGSSRRSPRACDSRRHADLRVLFRVAGRTAARLRSPGALPVAGARARRAPLDSRCAARAAAAVRRTRARLPVVAGAPTPLRPVVRTSWSSTTPIARRGARWIGAAPTAGCPSSASRPRPSVSRCRPGR